MVERSEGISFKTTIEDKKQFTVLQGLYKPNGTMTQAELFEKLVSEAYEKTIEQEFK